MKITKNIFTVAVSVLMLITGTNCLFGTYQTADPVGRNNIHISYCYANAGFLTEADKDAADSADIQTSMFSITAAYGLLNPLDFQISYSGTSVGSALKYSPDLGMPVRFAVLGGVMTDFSSLLISPKATLIGSWHISKNVTFSLGGSAYWFNSTETKGEVFSSVDIERGLLFNHKIPDFFANVFIPKAIQFNISYPVDKTGVRRLNLGFAVRHEFDLNFTSNNEII